MELVAFALGVLVGIAAWFAAQIALVVVLFHRKLGGALHLIGLHPPASVDLRVLRFSRVEVDEEDHILAPQDLR